MDGEDFQYLYNIAAKVSEVIDRMDKITLRMCSIEREIEEIKIRLSANTDRQKCVY